jgi:uncharacterized membrane protein YbhN (UPF0104 family)
MGYEVSYPRAVYASLATWPLALIAPSRANDFLRAHTLRRDIPPIATVGSVVAERVIDVQSLILLTGSGLLSVGRPWWAASAALAVIGLWVTVRLLLGQSERLGRIAALAKHRERLKLAGAAFRILFERPKLLALVAAFSLSAWGANLLLFHCLSRAFSSGLGASDVAALWPIAIFIGLLPVSFGGLGTRDAAFLWLSQTFVSAAVFAPGVLSATLGYALFTLGLYALLGLPFMVVWLLDARGNPPGTADSKVAKLD